VSSLAAPSPSPDPPPLEPSRPELPVPAALSAVADALANAQRDGGDPQVVDATHDSRQVAPGWLFCCVPGSRADGHDHAAGAIEAGATALLVERWLDLPVPQIKVPSVRAAIGPAAAVIQGHPSRDLTVVGVTGTNGKTTTTALLEGAFAAAGRGTGVIGTIATRIHGDVVPGVRTTPEGTDLQRLLRTMRTRGVDAVAIEVSSHGLDMRRIDGTRIAVALFTNLSQDHLDWHGSMEAYLAAKARLFTPALSTTGIVHLDGPWGRRVRDLAEVPITTFGRDEDADHRITDLVTDTDGGRARVTGPDGREIEVRTRLLGDFNVTNAVGAVLAAERAGIPLEAAIAGVAAASGPAGRMERVDAGQSFTVLVDYAHTPDALRQVIAAIRDVLDPGGRVHVVVGCGGDRDRGKRPQMGAAAVAADIAFLTSDNPRSEDPGVILETVAAGARDALRAGADAELHLEVDRRTAIAGALAGARPGDVVLIAGKGHETGQEFAETTVPFDDRQVARELLAGAAARPGERS
jgi:UDP-N-acetylmuramoyl-L-alanyl-D-glutamate--2,6-diaminopimelate ligase